MKNEHPILMQGEMIRAYQEGRKTMTRRVVKPQPACDIDGAYFDAYNGGPQWNWWLPDGRLCNSHDIIKCPYGVPGDRLWFRESWGVAPCYNNFKPSEIPLESARHCDYKADDPKYWDIHVDKWRPSIFMPRWASRYNPTITDIRVERVQEISEEDAFAEGIQIPITPEGRPLLCITQERPVPGVGAIPEFAALWERINAKRGFGWDSNPLVWVIEFERFEKCPNT